MEAHVGWGTVGVREPTAGFQRGEERDSCQERAGQLKAAREVASSSVRERLADRLRTF